MTFSCDFLWHPIHKIIFLCNQRLHEGPEAEGMVLENEPPSIRSPRCGFWSCSTLDLECVVISEAYELCVCKGQPMHVRFRGQHSEQFYFLAHMSVTGPGVMSVHAEHGSKFLCSYLEAEYKHCSLASSHLWLFRSNTGPRQATSTLHAGARSVEVMHYVQLSWQLWWVGRFPFYSWGLWGPEGLWFAQHHSRGTRLS
jgi:hypothetical protein